MSSASAPPVDEPVLRLSDVALRKRKNASAQAAFRQRRNNYISTLEETVINLEQVVRVLQDSCREAQAEAQELQQENARLKVALKDRESFWRAMWRKYQGSEAEEFPSFPSPSSTTTPYGTQQYQDSSNSLNQYSAQYPSNWPPQASSHSSNSPQFAESPTTLAPASDMFRYGEDQKVSLTNIEPIHRYMFPSSRSISPSSSTAPSSSTTSLTSSSFPQYAFDNTGTIQDRADFDYRRPGAHSADITLNGGMADVSGHTNDGVRYRLTNRRMDGNLHPLLSPLTGTNAASESGSQHGGSDGGDSYHARRATAPPHVPSRSPSPGVSPLSGTLAVIKASAFGALRRTRVRGKKPAVAVATADDPAQVARDVLESRGIHSIPADQPGPTPSKRRRISSDNDDLDS
ncbi:hypothetical protein D9757_002904 [Collybiopsis confluens]|uniref:BZIP domain-containing protein n=1 Tax=Collybiopsis confluens TaxID=2823264 RepID=A0A8H5HVS6_9AGAR|nr:hypothetical protein D9757_002904 [Collybiopsis confluens]